MNKVSLNHGVKIPVFRVFSGFYFIVFELNKNIYSLNLHTKAKYGNIWTRTDSEYILFSYSKSSVTRQKEQSQNGCYKKTKHTKFSEKQAFLMYVHVRTCVCVSRGKKGLFFRKCGGFFFL